MRRDPEEAVLGRLGCLGLLLFWLAVAGGFALQWWLDRGVAVACGPWGRWG